MSQNTANAFTLGYTSALVGEHVERAPFDTEEEAAAYNEGFREGCAQLADVAE